MVLFQVFTEDECKSLSLLCQCYGKGLKHGVFLESLVYECINGSSIHKLVEEKPWLMNEVARVREKFLKYDGSGVPSVVQTFQRQREKRQRECLGDVHPAEKLCWVMHLGRLLYPVEQQSSLDPLIKPEESLEPLHIMPLPHRSLLHASLAHTPSSHTSPNQDINYRPGKLIKDKFDVSIVNTTETYLHAFVQALSHLAETASIHERCSFRKIGILIDCQEIICKESYSLKMLVDAISLLVGGLSPLFLDEVCVVNVEKLGIFGWRILEAITGCFKHFHLGQGSLPRVQIGLSPNRCLKQAKDVAQLLKCPLDTGCSRHSVCRHGLDAQRRRNRRKESLSDKKCRDGSELWNTKRTACLKDLHEFDSFMTSKLNKGSLFMVVGNRALGGGLGCEYGTKPNHRLQDWMHRNGLHVPPACTSGGPDVWDHVWFCARQRVKYNIDQDDVLKLALDVADMQCSKKQPLKGFGVSAGYDRADKPGLMP
ncbi:hypothetical protein GNI_140450 [Gregarina niphandrodes]|uniref:Uncharacterized protein n=1 Tax=Gregarina niphandrodes TaxID=110365 RepID=A0A023B134_GRENI|nr:hypothetical protein GNI_140450 [Gregarina niphandrodes]EZG45116.1 hypothetical protein GNI_140450 [Gregarina niphandrodes]|eukprot:XP_011132550.1 hypothetical protein GNI_140450 [Gregarina niphandrodes]